MHTLILKKTDKGLEALRTRAPELPQRLRPLFILFDGQKSITQVLDMMPSEQGRLAVLAEVKQLAQHGLLALKHPPVRTPSGAAESPAQAGNPDERFFLDSSFGRFSSDAPQSPPAPAQHTSAPTQVHDPNQRYMQAYATASQLVSELGLKGFRLQLHVEKAQGYQDLVALLPRMRELIDARKLRPLEHILLAPDGMGVPASNAPTPAIIP